MTNFSELECAGLIRDGKVTKEARKVLREAEQNAKFKVNEFYVIDGMDMNALWSMSQRLCNGDRMSDDQRRDMGQRIQLMLDRASVFNP